MNYLKNHFFHFSVSVIFDLDLWRRKMIFKSKVS
jgi:hypothetical protein